MKQDELDANVQKIITLASESLLAGQACALRRVELSKLLSAEFARSSNCLARLENEAWEGKDEHLPNARDIFAGIAEEGLVTFRSASQETEFDQLQHKMCIALTRQAQVEGRELNFETLRALFNGAVLAASGLSYMNNNALLGGALLAIETAKFVNELPTVENELKKAERDEDRRASDDLARAVFGSVQRSLVLLRRVSEHRLETMGLPDENPTVQAYRAWRGVYCHHLASSV